MTRVRFWTILGESQTGKSRTIMELASLEPRGSRTPYRDILLRGGGYLNVYAKRMAWQENGKTPKDSVKEIKASIAAQRQLGQPPYAINILSALRFDAVTGPPACPGAMEYFRAWIAEGWDLESIVMMSPDSSRDFYSHFGAPTLWLYDSRDLNVGQMVGAVRNHFGWA